MDGVDIINYLLLVFAAGPTGDPLSVPRRRDLDKQIQFLTQGGKILKIWKNDLEKIADTIENAFNSMLMLSPLLSNSKQIQYS